MKNWATPVTARESAAARRELLASAFQGKLRWSDAIIRMRLSLGKTQEEFGQMFYLSRRQVIDLEKGKGNPRLETLTRIGRPFGLVIGFIPRPDLEAPPDVLKAAEKHD